MNCRKCNKEIDDDSKFCSFCGTKVKDTNAELLKYIKEVKNINKIEDIENFGYSFISKNTIRKNGTWNDYSLVYDDKTNIYFIKHEDNIIDSFFCVDDNSIESIKIKIEENSSNNTNENLKLFNQNSENNENINSMTFSEFYLNHKGSIGRKEFFFRGLLPLTGINLFLLLATNVTTDLAMYSNFFNFSKYLVFFMSFFSFIVTSNITVKRLHDINYNSWLFVLNFIPFVNIILLLFLLFIPSSRIRNYGETSFYKLTTSKISMSLFNVITIFILMFMFSLSNIFIKSYIEMNLVK